MPTKHRRIAVTEDEELADALARARSAFAPGTPLAAMVHDLAVRGAEHVVDVEQRRAVLRRVAEWSTRPGGIDRDALREARARSGAGWPDW